MVTLNDEVIERCDGYGVIWSKGNYWIGVENEENNFDLLREFLTLDEALTVYNELIEKVEKFR